MLGVGEGRTEAGVPSVVSLSTLEEQLSREWEEELAWEGEGES